VNSPSSSPFFKIASLPFGTIEGILICEFGRVLKSKVEWVVWGEKEEAEIQVK